MKQTPRYTNLTTLTKRQFYQFRENDFRKERAVLRRGIFVFDFLFTGVTIAIFLSIGISVWIFLNAFILLTSLWITMYGYRIRALREYEHTQLVRGKNPNITYLFYEDYVEMETEKSKVKINYGQIDKLMETKELYVLKVGNTGVLIAKNGFMSGNRRVFKKFMESRIENK